jgi:hypothetical protein
MQRIQQRAECGKNWGTIDCMNIPISMPSFSSLFILSIEVFDMRNEICCNSVESETAYGFTARVEMYKGDTGREGDV